MSASVFRLDSAAVQSLLKSFYHFGNLLHFDASFNVGVDVVQVLQQFFTDSVPLETVDLRHCRKNSGQSEISEISEILSKLKTLKSSKF